MSINIILQARTSSSRLPQKVLKPILGKPMLSLQLERVKRVKGISQIVVATSTQTNDDPIARLCQQHDVNCFRGSLENVLDRYYQAHLAYPSEHIVRLTGDCPVIDPEIISKVVQYHLTEHADYTSNCSPATLPDGLDVEVFTKQALKQAWEHAKKMSEKEHVTPYMREKTNNLICANYAHPIDYSDFRWTVDEPEDFALIEKIYCHLYPIKPEFGFEDILSLMRQHPDLITMNQNIKRNEGLLKSQLADKVIYHD